MELLVGQEIKRPIEFHWDITALTIKGNSHSFRFYKKKKSIKIICFQKARIR